ncbi:MAG: N-acetylmuramoyl-L-alanine amidase [Anaerovorax sp.]|nr:N-acetylmuramoyl-L-alanine amidase [Anaerovorax sp.]
MKQVIENLEPSQRRQIRRERLKRKRLKRKKIRRNLIFIVLSILLIYSARNAMIHFGFIKYENGESTVFKKIWSANSELLGTVMIDAGHGGNDSGTTEAEIPEKELNLQVALQIQRSLEKKGVRVYMTRKKDHYVSLEERVAMAQKEKPDLFISIHQNSFEDPSIRGMEVWYNEEKTIGGEESRNLAKKIEETISTDIEIVSRGVVEDHDLQVLRQTEMPAVLIEIGYVTNLEDRRLIFSEDYQQKVAEYIAEGVVACLLQNNDDKLI